MRVIIKIMQDAEALRHMVNMPLSQTMDRSLVAYALMLPDYGTLSQEVAEVDPMALMGALRHVRKGLAIRFESEFRDLYQQLAPPEGEPYEVNPFTVGRRRLRNLCLSYLSRLETSRCTPATSRPGGGREDCSP